MLAKKHNLILPMIMMGLMLSFSMTSCNKDNDENPSPAMSKDIVETASSDNNFSTLVAALNKANLASTLKGDGPFTVFAPTNTAFSQLLSDLGFSSLDDVPVETLKSILLYHVVSGKILSTDLKDGYISMLSTGPGGNYLSLLVDAKDVKLNASTNITQANLDASNGVIHVIDKVLLPPTVVDIASENPDFSILVEAVVKADLVNTLSGTGPFTIFAPTNEAFQNLFTSLGVSGISDLTKDQLTPILLHHVVSGNVRSTDLASGSVATLNGDINVMVSSRVTIDSDVHVLAADVQGSNGVIHVIDNVLLP